MRGRLVGGEGVFVSYLVKGGGRKIPKLLQKPCRNEAVQGDYTRGNCMKKEQLVVQQ